MKSFSVMRARHGFAGRDSKNAQCSQRELLTKLFGLGRYADDVWRSCSVVAFLGAAV